MANNETNRLRLTPITSADVGGSNHGKYITLDKQGRLMLSAALRRELAIDGVPAWLALSYDVKTRTIGIVKQDVERVANAQAIKVDTRGYTSTGGRAVADKLAIDVRRGPFRFVDAGRLDDSGVYWRIFRLDAQGGAE